MAVWYYCAGHPLSDLANMCGSYYMPAAVGGDQRPAHLCGLMGLDLGQLGLPDEQSLVLMYTSGSPLPLHVRMQPGAPGSSSAQAAQAGEQGLPWAFFMAMYFFKYAVIAQGVAARAASGNATSASAPLAKRYIPLLASMCRGKLQELQTAPISFNPKL